MYIPRVVVNKTNKETHKGLSQHLAVCTDAVMWKRRRNEDLFGQDYLFFLIYAGGADCISHVSGPKMEAQIRNESWLRSESPEKYTHPSPT